MAPLKLLYLDVETTGLASPACGLIQLGAVVEIDGVVRETFEMRMQPVPGDQIEDDALAVHGFDRAVLQQFPPAAAGYAAFLALLTRYIDRFDPRDKFHLVAYNAAFDAAHLRAWFEKHRDRFFGAWFWHPPIDVMGLAAALMIDKRAVLPNFKLATVAEALDVAVDPSQTHDALYDVRLTQAVYHLLRRRMAPA